MNVAAAAFSSVACFGAVAALAGVLRRRPTPAIDVASTRLRGKGTALAAFFTLLGRWPAIVAVAAVAALVARPVGASLMVAGLFVSQVAAQGAVGVVKARIRRARPEVWLLRLEGDTSFPSGHAATAAVFYLGLAIIAAHVAPVALRLPLLAVLACCIAGIPWSRMVLGAHYFTDVVAGFLFGLGWLGATGLAATAFGFG